MTQIYQLALQARGGVLCGLAGFVSEGRVSPLLSLHVPLAAPDDPAAVVSAIQAARAACVEKLGQAPEAMIYLLPSDRARIEVLTMQTRLIERSVTDAMGREIIRSFMGHTQQAIQAGKRVCLPPAPLAYEAITDGGEKQESQMFSSLPLGYPCHALKAVAARANYPEEEYQPLRQALDQAGLTRVGLQPATLALLREIGPSESREKSYYGLLEVEPRYAQLTLVQRWPSTSLTSPGLDAIMSQASSNLNGQLKPQQILEQLEIYDLAGAEHRDFPIVDNLGLKAFRQACQRAGATVLAPLVRMAQGFPEDAPIFLVGSGVDIRGLDTLFAHLSGRQTQGINPTMIGARQATQMGLLGGIQMLTDTSWYRREGSESLPTIHGRTDTLTRMNISGGESHGR